MAAAFRALESRKTGQGRAEKGVLGGEDVQSDHTHLTMCREEGKGQCWAGRWWRALGASHSSCFNSYLPPPIPGSPSLLQGFTIPEPGKPRHREVK